MPRSIYLSDVYRVLLGVCLEASNSDRVRASYCCTFNFGGCQFCYGDFLPVVFHELYPTLSRILTFGLPGCYPDCPRSRRDVGFSLARILMLCDLCSCSCSTETVPEWEPAYLILKGYQ